MILENNIISDSFSNINRRVSRRSRSCFKDYKDIDYSFTRKTDKIRAKKTNKNSYINIFRLYLI